MLRLTQKLSQQQKLTPQQLQYLKLLQLSAVALEQRVKEELEINPLLEEGDETVPQSSDTTDQAEKEKSEQSDDLDWEQISPQEGFDSFGSTSAKRNEDSPDIPQPAEETLTDRLLSQLRLQTLSDDDFLLAEEIVGNIDSDGYLRRELDEIVEDLNQFLAQSVTSYEENGNSEHVGISRVASATTISDLSLEEMASLPIEELARILERGTTTKPDAAEMGQTLPSREEDVVVGVAPTFSVERAEEILKSVQRLDPAGVGARSLRECLLVQLDVETVNSSESKLARNVLEQTYTEFTMKHFEKICRKLDCTEDQLREAIDVITSLNPKPGEGYTSFEGGNYVTPDFVVTRNGDEFTISSNDSFVPTVQISPRYREMLKKGKKGEAHTVNVDARKFLRQKMEAAKWFIASIHQRRETMMRVMHSILEIQIDFFKAGPDALRPLIYKDVAEKILMDISTVCRVVNGKYVQTDYGVFELRYFFSEALETAWGEEVSNKVVKSKIKEMIDSESKKSPLSDEAISAKMKELGYNVARRTVAKYREQMNMPVARLRREL